MSRRQLPVFKKLVEPDPIDPNGTSELDTVTDVNEPIDTSQAETDKTDIVPDGRPSPADHVNPFSSLTFWWMTRFIRKAFSKDDYAEVCREMLSRISPPDHTTLGSHC